MTCIPTTRRDYLAGDAGLSKKSPADTDERLCPPEGNAKVIEPVGILAENHEDLSKKSAESDEDILDLPKEVKFEILSDSEPDESSNENLNSGEPKSKRLCKIKPRSKNGIPPEIEKLTDLNLFENEEFAGHVVSNLKNNAVERNVQIGSFDYMSNGIEVVIKESIPEGDLRRQTGIIRDVNVGSCTIFLIQEERIVNIPSEFLVPSIPRIGDRVKVMKGEYREQIGHLRSVDENDGIVELEANIERPIQFLPLSYLCKLME